MTTLQRRYREWRAWDPGDRVCCRQEHEYSKFSHSPKPDNDVCEREKAWREYVRERDGNPRFMRDGVLTLQINPNEIKGKNG